MVSSSRTSIIAYAAVALSASAPLAAAFSVPQQPLSTDATSSSSSRRSFLTTIVTASTASIAVLGTPFAQPAYAADTRDSLLADLNDSLSKIQALPGIIENLEWDKARTVLKTPPVNELWNLGESKNTLTKLAKETGEFDLMEMKDELAISLQMTDQYSYDNNFIYYQPGNGKIKTKEPLEMANKAITQLKEAIDVANST